MVGVAFICCYSYQMLNNTCKKSSTCFKLLCLVQEIQRSIGHYSFNVSINVIQIKTDDKSDM